MIVNVPTKSFVLFQNGQVIFKQQNLPFQDIYKKSIVLAIDLFDDDDSLELIDVSDEYATTGELPIPVTVISPKFVGTPAGIQLSEHN